MKLQVHSIHFDADIKLIDFIQKKLNKLETFYDRLVDGEVFLRLNNEGVENKTVEIKVGVPGNQLFAIEKARSFEAATDLAADALHVRQGFHPGLLLLVQAGLRPQPARQREAERGAARHPRTAAVHRPRRDRIAVARPRG